MDAVKAAGAKKDVPKVNKQATKKVVSSDEDSDDEAPSALKMGQGLKARNKKTAGGDSSKHAIEVGKDDEEEEEDGLWGDSSVTSKARTTQRSKKRKLAGTKKDGKDADSDDEATESEPQPKKTAKKAATKPASSATRASKRFTGRAKPGPAPRYTDDGEHEGDVDDDDEKQEDSDYFDDEFSFHDAY